MDTGQNTAEGSRSSGDLGRRLGCADPRCMLAQWSHTVVDAPFLRLTRPRLSIHPVRSGETRRFAGEHLSSSAHRC